MSNRNRRLCVAGSSYTREYSYDHPVYASTDYVVNARFSDFTKQYKDLLIQKLIVIFLLLLL